MGYSHYWTAQPKHTTPEALEGWTKAALDIIECATIEQGIRLADWGGDEQGAWEVTESGRVRLNGFESERCESFSFDPLSRFQTDCKTRERPYDAVVTALLITARALLRTMISSDGEVGSWAAGLKLAHQAGVCRDVTIDMVGEWLAIGSLPKNDKPPAASNPLVFKVLEPTPRALSVIAREIRRLWTRPYFGAVPYMQAMASLESVHDAYGLDPGREIVNYFLANAATWRGEDAKRIKAELKSMLKPATAAKRRA